MTGDRVAEIRERLEAATGGPWSREDFVDVDQDGAYDLANVTAPAPDEPDIAVQGVALGILRPDADLIAHAPADLAYLLAELESANRRLAAVEALAEDMAAQGKHIYAVFDAIPKPQRDPLVEAKFSEQGRMLRESAHRIRAALATGEGEDNGE